MDIKEINKQIAQLKKQRTELSQHEVKWTMVHIS